MSINNDHNIHLTYNHINKALSDQEKKNEKKATAIILTATVIVGLAYGIFLFSLGLPTTGIVLTSIGGACLFGPLIGRFISYKPHFEDFKYRIGQMLSQIGNNKVTSDHYKTFVQLVDKETLARLYQPENPPPPYSYYTPLNSKVHI